MSASDRLRIGDQERESAAAALGEHYSTGRLTRDELDERSRLALEARTMADLRPLFADVPLPHGPLQHGTHRRVAGSRDPARGVGDAGPPPRSAVPVGTGRRRPGRADGHHGPAVDLVRTAGLGRLGDVLAPPPGRASRPARPT